MSIYIVDTGKATILGPELIRPLHANVLQLDQSVRQGHHVSIEVLLITTIQKDIATIHKRFADIFTSKIGCVPAVKFTTTLRLRLDTKPTFLKSCKVPFALYEKTEIELKTPVQRIISPITNIDWGSPLVGVPKPDSTVCLCLHNKIAVNSQVEYSHYPILCINEILHTLRNS